MVRLPPPFGSGDAEPPPYTDPPDYWWGDDPADVESFAPSAGALTRKAGGPGVGEPASERVLPIVYFQDINARTEVLDFVEGLLIEKSSIVVYGESNAGKTFCVTDLALHVAAGKEWLGRQVDQSGVVYCVLEGGFGFDNRVAAWKRHHDLAEARLPFAAIPSSLNLLDPNADVPALIAAIKAVAATLEMPVKLVVIDTFARAMAGGNENSPEDMGAMVKSMDAIRAETGAALLYIHHSGKDRAKGARGHSSLRAAIDTEIEVVALVDEDGKETGERTATVVKQRDLPKGAVFDFALRTVQLGTDRRNNPVTSCIVEKPPTPTAKAEQDPQAAEDLEKIAQALGENGQMTASSLLKAIAWTNGGRANKRLATLIPLAPRDVEFAVDGQRVRLWRVRLGEAPTSPIKIVRKDME